MFGAKWFNKIVRLEKLPSMISWESKSVDFFLKYLLIVLALSF